MRQTFLEHKLLYIIDDLLGFSLGVDGSSISRSSGVGVTLPSREEGGLGSNTSSSPLNNVSNNSTTSNYNSAPSTIHATITNCQP